MVSWAASECPKLDPLTLQRQTDIFRDHTFSTARTDWGKTWRNWMRKANDIVAGTRPGALLQGTGETPYQRSQRERVAEATGGLANRNAPGTPATNDERLSHARNPLALG